MYTHTHTHTHTVAQTVCESKNLLKRFVWVKAWREYEVQGFWGLLLNHVVECGFSMY